MRIFELSRPYHMEDADPILVKAGWHEVGEGYYGKVYGKPGVDYVLKVFDYRDRAYLDFLKLVLSHPNPHWPKLKGKVLKITPRYWAVRMEKLEPIRGIPTFGVYLKCRDTPKEQLRGIQPEVLAKALEYLKTRPSLREALDLIIDNLMSRYNEDLHGENMMQRPDGTEVIIDPVIGSL